MSDATARSIRRAGAIAGLILLAIGIDALTGFSVLAPAGCVLLFIVQLLAMTAGAVLALIGLVVWVFSGFRSRQALYLVIAALALAAAGVLLDDALTWIGLACVD